MSFYDKGHLFLTIEESDTEDGILMALRGELRSHVNHHIQDELDAFTTIGKKVAIDFKEVTGITYSVLTAFLNSQQLVDSLRKGEICLKRIPDAVYQEMDKWNIIEMLLIED